MHERRAPQKDDGEMGVLGEDVGEDWRKSIVECLSNPSFEICVGGRRVAQADGGWYSAEMP
jgi:hypothetical protein